MEQERDKRLVARVVRHLKQSNAEVTNHLRALLDQLAEIFEDNSEAFSLVQLQTLRDIDRAYNAMLYLVMYPDNKDFDFAGVELLLKKLDVLQQQHIQQIKPKE